jgi:hypothetical protein
MPNNFGGVIEQATDLSVATKNEPKYFPGGAMGGAFFLYLANQNSLLPQWWSKGRDIELRRFWKKVDHLAGTVYTIESKLQAIPFRVIARDQSNRRHVQQAEEYTNLLLSTAQYGAGWSVFYQRFVEDILTTDNGGFAEIIGEGDPAGPIEGKPITVAHLDSARTTRTGNKLFPVIYTDDNGTPYKLHYTRVMNYASMSSPIKEMNGVGFSAISRVTNVAQNLLDIMIYKMEKLGSRPSRGLIITSGGLDPEDVRNAFSIAEQEMNNRSLSRYSKTIVIGDATLQDAKINLVNLAELPDGFDEETSTLLAMGAISLAFGVDSREIFPAMRAGQTRAEAVIQNMKQRGKGPGQILLETERMFNSLYLPAHLYMLFDYQDDAEDRQKAETSNIRSQRRERDLKSKSIDVATTRERMVNEGDITQEQRVRMELEDGRLADGTSLLNLFYSTQETFSRLLDVGMDDPLDNTDVNLVELDGNLSEKVKELRGLIANSPDGTRKNNYVIAFYALMALGKHYGITTMFPELKEDMGYTSGSAGGDLQNAGGSPRVENRTRRVATENVTDNEQNPDVSHTVGQDWYDSEASVSKEV